MQNRKKAAETTNEKWLERMKQSMEGIYLDGKDDRSEHIEGVSCSVKNCVYHDGELHCTAKKIAVGTTAATSCGETMCATFKPRTDTIG